MNEQNNTPKRPRDPGLVEESRTYRLALARYIQDIRGRKNLLASEVADAIGMSRSSLSRLEDEDSERSGVRLDTLIMIARLQGIKLSELFATLERDSMPAPLPPGLEDWQTALLKGFSRVNEDLARDFLLALDEHQTSKVIGEPSSWVLQLAIVLLGLPMETAVRLEEDAMNAYLKRKDLPDGRRKGILGRLRQLVGNRLNTVMRME